MSQLCFVTGFYVYFDQLNALRPDSMTVGLALVMIDELRINR